MRLRVLALFVTAFVLLLALPCVNSEEIDNVDVQNVTQLVFTDETAELLTSQLTIVPQPATQQQEPQYVQEELLEEELEIGANRDSSSAHDGDQADDLPEMDDLFVEPEETFAETPQQVPEQEQEKPKEPEIAPPEPVVPVTPVTPSEELPVKVEKTLPPTPEAITVNTPVVAEEEAHPIQLIYPSPDHELLLVNETNLAYLASFNKPVAVVAVCGPLHSGKSFLMNQLLGRTSGFALGPTTEPKTRGLWMWNKPLELDSKLVVFLDTEGLFASNISEAYDAKIFAISSLMSSYLIYNSVKFIDQSAIDYIELLARRAQLFGIKAEITETGSDLPKSDMDAFVSLPNLLWIVQDFVQEMVNHETPKMWLNNLLATRKKSESTASSLPELFGDIDCFTLFLPEYRREKLRHLDLVDDADLLPDYRADMALLRGKVIENAVVKRRGPYSLTGGGIAALLRTLVSASNKGAFPEVPSIWKSFLTAQTQQAIHDASNFYDSTMEAQCDLHGPFNKQELVQLHSETLNDTRTLFSRLTFGFKDIESQNIEELLTKVSRLYATYESSNQANLTQICQDHYQKARDAFKQLLRKVETPLKKSELRKRLTTHFDTQVELFRSSLKRFNQEESFKLYIRELEANMKGDMSTMELQNSELLQQVIANASAEAVTKCSHFLQEQDQTEQGVGIESLNKFKAEAVRTAQEFFEKKAGFALEDYPMAGAARKGLEKELQEVLNAYEVRNSERVERRTLKVSLSMSREITKLCEEIRLPQAKTIIESRVSKIRDEFLQKFDTTVQDVGMMGPTKIARQKIVEEAKRDLEELYRRNNVKYDKIISHSLPDLKQSLAPLIDSYWWPANAIDFAKRSVNSTLHTVELIENEDLIAELAQRFIDTNLKDEIQSIWQRLYIIGGVGLISIIGIFVILCRKK